MAADSMEQQLRFRWNDHMQHLSKVLTLQRLQEQYCDITLVSEDGYLTKAHQAVLASTSTYFERVLGDIRPEQHPMVVLRGANLQELTCLLDYMYQGKTQVDQSLIESVLEVADLLGVKGLSGIRSNPAIQKFMAAAPTPTPTAAPTVPANPTVTSEGVQGAGDLSHPPASPAKDGDPPQTSGIDLSMAKNEPRSPKDVVGVTSSLPPPATPREGSLGGVEGLPPPPPTPSSLLPPPHSTGACRKRRRLDSPSSEDNLDSASDPDWGRISSQVEEAPRPTADAQPRTITLTAISTAAAAATVRTFNGACPGGGGRQGGEGGTEEVKEEERVEGEEEEEELSSLFSTATLPSPPHPTTTTTTTTRPESPPSPSPSQTTTTTTTTTTPALQRGGQLMRPRNAVKRPMNKYLLFYRDTQRRVRAEHPDESFQSVKQRVAALWRGLPVSEKQEWEVKAQLLQAEHKLRHPDYLYSPREASERRREYMRQKEERRKLFRSSPHHHHHIAPTPTTTTTSVTTPIHLLHQYYKHQQCTTTATTDASTSAHHHLTTTANPNTTTTTMSEDWGDDDDEGEEEEKEEEEEAEMMKGKNDGGDGGGGGGVGVGGGGGWRHLALSKWHFVGGS